MLRETPRRYLAIRAAIVFTWPSRLHFRVERIGGGDHGLIDDVALDDIAQLFEVEAVLKRYRRHVQRIHMVVVVMDDGVVPRRARAIIAVVMAFHVRIALEPAGVAVESLDRARRTDQVILDPAIALATGNDALAT